MARVKRAVHAKKHRRATLERAKGYYGNKSRSLPRRQRAGHALACSTPTATAGPARATSARSGSSASTPPAARTASSYSRFIAGLKAGRGRGRPQGPRRPRRHRRRPRSPPWSRRPPRPLERRRRRPPAPSLTGRRWPIRSAPDTTACSGCGASRGAAVRVPTRARSWSTGPTLRRRGARRRRRPSTRSCAEPGASPTTLLGRAPRPPASPCAASPPACWPRVADTVTPQPVAAVGPPAATSPRPTPSPRPAALALVLRRRRRPRQRRHAAAHGRGGRCRGGRVLPTARSTRSPPSACGPRPGRSSGVAGRARRRRRRRARRACAPRACAPSAPCARGGDALRRGRPRPARSPSCSAARPTACPPTWPAAVDEVVTIPMAGRGRVAERGDGGRGPVLRGAAPAPAADRRRRATAPIARPTGLRRCRRRRTHAADGRAPTS